MIDIRTDLLLNWDENTEKKLDIKLLPYKCDWCGRRSKTLYQTEKEWEDMGTEKLTLCKKHYFQLKDD